MTKESRVLKEFFKLGYDINKNGVVTNPKGKIVKGCGNPIYLKIGLRILEFKSFSLKIHRIQAYKKYGNKIFEEGIKIRHLNNIPTDNSWDNILTGTHSDNMMDIPKEKRRQMASNPRHNHSAIIKDYNNGMTYKQLMQKYNVSSKGTISFIIKKSLVSEE